MLRLITYIDSRERFPTQLCWDEENRLMSFADCENAGFYQYDAGGERTYKLTSDYVSQNIGGHWHTYQVLDNPTLYTSPYMVATPKGYTKHYYAESERVASRIGGGLDSVDMFIQNFEEFVDKPTVEISPLWTDEYHKEPFEEKRDHNLDHLYSAMECADNVPTVLFECLTILYKYSQHPHHEYEPDCYWYHPDHLGSSSWITFSDGKAVQHLHYLPWGENFVDQRSSTFDGVRYTFSAKEKDAETGYSYFGSRYYNSDLSIWLSVDPMADKYPSMSSYVYCADNPIKLVDPNGEEVINVHEKLMNDAQDKVNKLTKELSQYKKGSEEYRMIDQKLTKAQHNLDRETKNYNAVNQAIDDFKSKMSVEFEEIDNLTYGDDIINVYVSIKNFGGPDIMGQCEINHDGFNVDNSKLGLTGKGVVVNLNGGYPKLGKTLAHEFGHVSYEVNNSASYVNWLNENGHKNEKGYDGHGTGDPSGAKANEWERRYDSK